MSDAGFTLHNHLHHRHRYHAMMHGILTIALRDLSRRRASVELRCPAPLHGTIDRVARDHLDLAIHEAGTTRHPRHVVGVELVPFAAIDWVRLP